MSIEDQNVIDAISLDQAENALLIISDHLEWDYNNHHLLLLQEKINAYLNSIESGNLNEVFPEVSNRRIVISIVSKFEPNADGKKFIEGAKKIIESAGYGFLFQVFSQ